MYRALEITCAPKKSLKVCLKSHKRICHLRYTQVVLTQPTWLAGVAHQALVTSRWALGPGRQTRRYK